MDTDKQKVAVDTSSLKSAAELLEKAQSAVNGAFRALDGVDISVLFAPGTNCTLPMTMVKETSLKCSSAEEALLTSIASILVGNASILDQFDQLTNNIPSTTGLAHSGALGKAKKKVSGGSTGGFSSYSSNNQNIDSNLETGVIGLPAATIAPNEKDVNTPIQPTVDVRTESYQKLENLLKNGTITSETTALYDTLKTLGKGDEADSLLKKYGYVASKDANGNTVISKIKSETTKTDSTKVPNNSNTDKKNNDSDTEVVASEVKPTDNKQENNSNKNSYTTVNRKEYSSGNRKDISSNNNVSTTQNTETKPETSNATNTIKDNSNKVLDRKDKTNVINITDDSTSNSKKSGGMGAAVPIGLGAIAAGAAAVAGVRYVKNRHDNQEEYDEEYDDEDNKLEDSNDQYVDSAQYSNENDYTSDDYLGPAGSTYTDVNSNDIEDNYVDPEELEADSDDSDFSNDKVLEQLNFDGQ